LFARLPADVVSNDMAVSPAPANDVSRLNADPVVVELAVKIANGDPIDWNQVEERSHDHNLPIAAFRMIQAIARAYRRLFPRRRMSKQ
jgi:hypothetical protein